MTQPTSTQITIKPAERCGSVLVGRDDAAELRLEIERLVAAGNCVVVDFIDVAALAPSFADELLAKLPVRVRDGGQVTVEHLDRSSAALVKMAVARRR